MNQQGAQLPVAVFSQPMQTLTSTGTVLPGDKPTPGGHLSAITETLPITKFTDQGGGRQWADARNPPSDVCTPHAHEAPRAACDQGD